MSMLAEPRQRKRYNLVPKGRALYEDETRFGTKMLERMGWKKGQGLGAKEDGSKDFVRVRYKNDALGLGFEERDDQWTQHEQNFNGLLKTLNNEDDSISCKENDKTIESEEEMPIRVGFGFQDTNKSNKTKVEKMKEKISGVSLEERSKQSRARVHYKKFTKGKDLAQYSEKDLANIFGKKVVGEQQRDANDFYQCLNNTLEESREISSGVQTINTGVSVTDYFKTKLESRKAASNDFDVIKNGVDNSSTSNKVKFEETNEINEDIEKKDKQIFYSNLSVNDYFKNKMEALKKGNKTNLNYEENQFSNETPQEDAVIKKKKKSKKEIKERENDCLPEPVEMASKKSNNRSSQENCESVEIKETQVLEKEKKYNKNCEIDKIDKLALDDVVKVKSEEHVSKKQKKKRRTEDNVDNTLVKKSKKIKDHDDGENSENFQNEEVIKKIKKSMKSDKNKYSITEETCELAVIRDHPDKAQNKSKKCDIGAVEELHLDDSAETNNDAEVMKKVKKSKKREEEKAKPSIDNSLLLPVEKKSKKNKVIVVQENSDTDEIGTNLKVTKKEEKCKEIVLVESSEFNFESKTKKSKSKKKMQNGEENDISTAVKRKSEPLLEIELTQEPTKKKKKRKTNTIENIGISNLDDGNNEEIAHETESQVIIKQNTAGTSENVVTMSNPVEQNADQLSIKPKKSKRNQESCNANNKSIENIEIVDVEDSCKEEITRNRENRVTKEQTTDSTCKSVVTISKPVEATSDKPLIKPKKAKIKQVSSTAKNVFITDVNIQALDLEEIKNQYQAFNIYPISSFCAEKFRNIDLNCFTGSILPQLEGYGLSSDIQLDVKMIKNDEKRITNLWKCALNKYVQLEQSRKTYKQYLREAIHARKTRNKLPKLNVKTLKRKNVFQVL